MELVYRILANSLKCIFSILIFLCVLLPLHIYRFLIGIYGKYFYSNVGSIVELRSAVYTPSKCSLSPSGNVVITTIFTQIDIFELTRAAQKLADGDPKFKCFGETILGYDFWIRDTNFDINNHLCIIYKGNPGPDNNNPGPDNNNHQNKDDFSIELESLNELASQKDPKNTKYFTAQDLPRIQTHILQEVQPKGQSPWKLCLAKSVLHTEESDGSVVAKDVLFIKFHHSQGDGHSILKMLLGTMASGATSANQRLEIKPGSRSNIFDQAWIWLLAVGTLTDVMFPPKTERKINILTPPRDKMFGLSAAYISHQCSPKQ